MVIVQSYGVALICCVVTMLCWGSWANTQKLTGKQWRFELFYWDYVFGVFLLSLVAALTFGSAGTAGRPFLDDLGQAAWSSVGSAVLGGVVFNAANILLVAAIAIAGMAVAFPVGIGIALVLGVLVNYLAAPVGNAFILFLGVGLVAAAIILDALAYRRVSSDSGGVTTRGLMLSLSCGILMGFFYRFVAQSMSLDFQNLEAGKLGPYSAVFLFSVGLLVSNLVFNTLIMKKPFAGEPVSFDGYRKGGAGVHFYGILGGAIWGVGMMLNIIASGQAGFAISYGLGQGATMIAAIWGVFIWKEFAAAGRSVNRLLVLMFAGYFAGLALIIVARLV